jgi:hypothetical protein
MDKPIAIVVYQRGDKLRYKKLFTLVEIEDVKNGQDEKVRSKTYIMIRDNMEMEIPEWE